MEKKNIQQENNRDLSSANYLQDEIKSENNKCVTKKNRMHTQS